MYVGKSNARDFTGKHGDGNLLEGGGADVDNLIWKSGGLNGRGGSYNRAVGKTRVSDRSADIARAQDVVFYGGRAVRTAK